ncbi:Uncharacterized protein Rs2_10224 [Raphanus sativus]|nr:Uncharacterized protein Rs2_10224 [Raphanus sativus]
MEYLLSLVVAAVPGPSNSTCKWCEGDYLLPRRFDSWFNYSVLSLSTPVDCVTSHMHPCDSDYLVLEVKERRCNCGLGRGGVTFGFFRVFCQCLVSSSCPSLAMKVRLYRQAFKYSWCVFFALSFVHFQWSFNDGDDYELRQVHIGS